MADNAQVYSNLPFYCMSAIQYYGTWDDGVSHCAGYELRSVQISMMCNDEVNAKLYIRYLYNNLFRCNHRYGMF